MIHKTGTGTRKSGESGKKRYNKESSRLRTRLGLNYPRHKKNPVSYPHLAGERSPDRFGSTGSKKEERCRDRGTIRKRGVSVNTLPVHDLLLPVVAFHPFCPPGNERGDDKGQRNGCIDMDLHLQAGW